jgi:hypothetical protein
VAGFRRNKVETPGYDLVAAVRVKLGNAQQATNRQGTDF